jgi:hypothetical protein
MQSVPLRASSSRVARLRSAAAAVVSRRVAALMRRQCLGTTPTGALPACVVDHTVEDFLDSKHTRVFQELRKGKVVQSGAL